MMSTTYIKSGSEFDSNDLVVEDAPTETVLKQEMKKEAQRNVYVWCWGRNKNGELSLNCSRNANVPRDTKGLKGKKIKQIVSGEKHSAALTVDGELLICGSYLHGIDGLTVTTLTVFTPVPALKGKKVKEVACGDYHTLALLEDGTVYAWGGTLHKKLGDRDISNKFHTPAVVSSLNGKSIIAIACGIFHSIALSSNGELYSWGGGGVSYNKGQCGQGHNKDVDNPTIISALLGKKIVMVSSGGYHTLALTSERELYSWGSGLYGECGTGELVDIYSPKKVVFVNGVTSENVVMFSKIPKDAYFQPEIKALAAGGHHSLVLTTNGELYSFGYGSYGQLGQRMNYNQCLPQLVKDLKKVPISQIAAGWHHSIALTIEGNVYVCGNSQCGELGLGNEESKTRFTLLASVGQMSISRIFSGGYHSWIILDYNQPYRQWVPPSPIIYSENTTPFKERIREKEELSLQDRALINMNNESNKGSLQVFYCEVECLHRFIRLCIPEKSIQGASIKFRDLVQDMGTQDEVLYSYFQEDENIFEEGKLVSPCKIKGAKCFTGCVIVSNKKSVNSIKPAPDLLAKILTIKEEMLNDPVEKLFSGWVHFVHKHFKDACLEAPILFELRPFCTKQMMT